MADVVARELRALAENARSQQETWWLWDEPRTPGTGPLLEYAHAASPETVLELLDRIDLLEAVKDAAAQYLRWHKRIASGYPLGARRRLVEALEAVDPGGAA